jgi:acetyl esterase/lipase
VSPIVPRLLVAAALAQVVLIYVPLPTWTLWIARFAAIEGCLLASALGLGALLLGGGQPFVQGLAVIAMIGGLTPAIGISAVYRSEHQHFSPLAWLTGGPTPDVKIDRDVALAPGLLADVYHAPGPGPHPWVMVVHGGSWRSGGKGDAPRESMAFAEAGFTVIDVAYRLAPQFPFPAAIEDVRCLLGAARAQATALGIDPARAALLGRSAGAQIALVAAYSDLPASCGGSPGDVRAVISVYGPTDLAWSHDNPFVPDVVQGTSALEVYLGGTPEQQPENYRLATPMTWASGPVPPTLLLHGTAERCVRPVNAQRLHDALVEHGKSVKLVLVPFADHGFDVRPGGLGSQLARGVILDFLKEHL